MNCFFLKYSHIITKEKFRNSYLAVSLDNKVGINFAERM